MRKIILTAFAAIFFIMTFSVQGSDDATLKSLPDKDAKTILTAPAGMPDFPTYCETIYYYGDATYYKLLPDEYGVSLPATRFTITSSLFPVCTLKISWIAVFADAIVGAPDMRVYLYEDNGFGLPGYKLDSVDVPFEQFPPSGIGFVAADWTSSGNSWTFLFGDPDFHIVCDILPGGPGDTLAIIYDDGEGPFSGDERSSMFYDGNFYLMNDLYGTDYVWFMATEFCGQVYWTTEDGHKMHEAQFPRNRYPLVEATGPLMLADDWICSETGWVKDIHFWGDWQVAGWFKDIHLSGDWQDRAEGELSGFAVSIFADIPAELPEIPYSRPGELLWEFYTDDFGYFDYDPSLGALFYDPSTGVTTPQSDGQFYKQYDIYLDTIDWFWQNAGAVYWLSVHPVITNPDGVRWGWKGSYIHWNDNAVWTLESELNWNELYEPPEYTEPIDLSFVINGEPPDTCYCTGDVNGDGISLTVSDMVYLTQFVYFGGPPPMPSYKGDLNGDCFVDEMDVDLYQCYLEYGMVCFPEYPVPTCCNPDTVRSACCDFALDSCRVLALSNCELIGGVYQGDNVMCEPDPCSTICDCSPGDPTGPPLNILDVTYIISYLYKNGPAPQPYPLCMGDANCDCQLNILDVTYLIRFLYKFDSPPCTCEEWLDICGQPLRK